MRGFKILLCATALLTSLAFLPAANAQVVIGIDGPPVCSYGYYDYAPYNCSPNGYYGPQYFNGGAFIGVGPWFHGANEFHGTVNNRYDPQHGYKGAMPHAGDKAAPQAKAQAFKGNEERDGRGNVAGGKSGKR